MGNRVVEAVFLPLHFMAVAVAKGSTEHRQPDYVGVARCVSKGSSAVDSHEDRYVGLARPHRHHAVDAVVLAMEVDFIALEKAVQNFDGLSHAGLSDGRSVKGDSNCYIFVEGVARSDANLESPPAQVIDSCELPRQVDGMVKVVVQHQWADSKPCRCLGHRHKWREGSGTVVHVIPRVHDIESEIFDSSGMRGDLIEVEFARLKPKTKWMHVMSLPTRWGTFSCRDGNVCPLSGTRQ